MHQTRIKQIMEYWNYWRRKSTSLLKSEYGRWWVKRYFVTGRQAQGTFDKPPGEVDSNEGLSKIRNIGIMAHIDAGKTTTTERMLFYSGRSKAMGDVDDGDTVTDYMEQERARGITITSAAVTFTWLGHRINLIDTPGHVDFTMEVERCLRVLDGAITVLDASAGVEAQSLTVWNQASRYGVPLIVYLNKMDKPKANVSACLKSISDKFRVPPLLTQLPIYNENSSKRNFAGVVDLSRMERLEWAPRDDTLGRTFAREALREDVGSFWESSKNARHQLIESVAELDDELANVYLNVDDPMAVTGLQLEGALRRIALARTGLPVVCGSSQRNVGVQPLLDAVLRYLPSPLDRSRDFASHYGADLCALAFKVIHDQERGRLTFLRLYSGELRPGQRVYNLSHGTSEKVGLVLTTQADDFNKDLASIGTGNIALVTGLQSVVTGDTLVASLASAEKARKSFRKLTGDDDHPNGAVLAGVEVPQPVFFCSIEPASLSHEKPLNVALNNLQLEDPSLRVTIDADTGQTVIAGMGELHLEIIRDRLLREYKVEAYLGSLQVAYHETLESSAERQHVLDRTLGDTRHHVVVHLSLEHHDDCGTFKALHLVHTRDNQANLAQIRNHHRQALEAGVISALGNGPLAGFPVTDVKVGLHFLEVGRGTSLAMVTAAAAQCVRLILSDVSAVGENRAFPGIRLHEPAMTLEIAVPENHMHSVLADLSRRRANVLHVITRHDGYQLVSALAPLSELVGYSTILRTITSGMAVFSMEFHSYVPMSAHDQGLVIQQIRYS